MHMEQLHQHYIIDDDLTPLTTFVFPFMRFHPITILMLSGWLQKSPGDGPHRDCRLGSASFATQHHAIWYTPGHRIVSQKPSFYPFRKLRWATFASTNRILATRAAVLRSRFRQLRFGYLIFFFSALL